MDLVHAGGTTWFLVDYKPSPERTAFGEGLKARQWDRLKYGLKPDAGALWIGDLTIAGYCLIGEFHFPGEVNREELVRALQKMQRATPKDLDAAWDEGIRQVDGTALDEVRTKTIEDFFEAEGKSIYRHARRKVTGKGRGVVTVPKEVH